MTDRLLLALGDGTYLLWFYAGPVLKFAHPYTLAEAIPLPQEYPEGTGLVIVWEGEASFVDDDPESGVILSEEGWRWPTPEEWALFQDGKAPWADAKWSGCPPT